MDQATSLTSSPCGSLRGSTSGAYWNFNGPLGGVTAAILMRGVLERPDRLGAPCSITVNFTAAVARGPFDATVHPVRTGRSVQHWYVELRQADVVAANATIVCAKGNAGSSARRPAATSHVVAAQRAQSPAPFLTSCRFRASK
ncbi:acyl-CoA thioesterase domain-containing protein [Enhydrobacter sp.]|uniref:acyl-CoA thioesterase domain-containing protein n=1 Tax=Enhydrobacter sp. TaxID=1894999 RepID=UPI0026045168|nr:acyl-CoA thioesterase domain-containing protein [Enhydrobacter sp.]